MRNAGPGMTRERMAQRIEQSGAFVDGMLNLAVEADGRLVGDVQARAQGVPHGVVELGITLFRTDDRGRGLGREAVALLTQHLFDAQLAERVQGSTDVENAAMRRVFELLGFRDGGRDARLHAGRARPARRLRPVRRPARRVARVASRAARARESARASRVGPAAARRPSRGCSPPSSGSRRGATRRRRGRRDRARSRRVVRSSYPRVRPGRRRDRAGLRRSRASTPGRRPGTGLDRELDRALRRAQLRVQLRESGGEALVRSPGRVAGVMSVSCVGSG